MINDIGELKVLCMMSTVRTEYSILIGSLRTADPGTIVRASQAEKKGLTLALEKLMVRRHKASLLCGLFFRYNQPITSVLQDTSSTV